jgi:hypothetical protein
MNLSDYRESIDLRTQGAPLPVDDAIFFVKRYGTPESNKILKDLRMQLFGPLHKMQDADYDTIHAHWLTDYGVTGWEGVQDEQGETLEYSTQTARAIFTNPEYMMSLNRILIDGACAFENYLHEEAEQDTEVLKKK